MNRATLAITTLALIAALAGGLALAADKPPAPNKIEDSRTLRSAVRFAMTYTNALQAGKGSQAVAEGWDFDSILADVFGKALKKHSAAEVTEIKRRLHALIAHALDNKDLSAALSVGQFADYAAKGDDDGHAVVTFQFALGETKVPNKLVLAPRGDSWRVVDTDVNGTSLVHDLRAGYVKVAEAFTPLQFARLATAELEKQQQHQQKQPDRKDRR